MAIRMLMGKSDAFSLPQDLWASLLVLAQDWGWRPEQPRIAYLAPGTSVSGVDAANLSAALQTGLKGIVADPIFAHGVFLSLAFLKRAVGFFDAGGFEILE